MRRIPSCKSDGPSPSHNRMPKGYSSMSRFEHIPNHIRIQDIHNSFYTDSTQTTEWAFTDEDLPKFPIETKTLRIHVVTWNLYGKKPKDCLKELLNIEKVKHHIISIGTEECLRSIKKSTFYNSKSYWKHLLLNYLADEYTMISAHKMNALHLTLFAHKSIASYIQGIEYSEVRTGMRGTLGNKGAIGITFKLYGASFLFINCHLSSGQSQAKQRNEDIEKIVKEMELPKVRRFHEKKHKQKYNLLDRFDFVFWSGDLNYRVNQTRENTINLLKTKNLKALLKEDQLSIERKNTRILNEFQEGEIKFPPTYKYQINTQLFDNKKHRTPSWTDRVLFRYNKDHGKLTLVNYESIHGMMVSDHRPVFAQFEATITKKPDDIKDRGFVTIKSRCHGRCNIF